MSQLLERPDASSKNYKETVSRADYEKLFEQVKRVEGRMRRQEAVRNLPVAVLAGGVIGLVVAIASRITPIFTTMQVLLLTLGAVLVLVAASLGYSLLRPRQILDTARRTDRLLGLKERISTAIEGYNNPEELGYAEF